MTRFRCFARSRANRRHQPVASGRSSLGDDRSAHNTITVTNPPLSPDRTLSVDTAQFGGFVATVDGCRVAR
jgi:hypothetical protein